MRYYSIWVSSNNDIYLAGYVEASAGYSGGLEIRHQQATLWKDGKIQSLDIDKNSDSQVYSIFVK